ncbi:MAG: hypothetical protein Kow0092_06550 [Deferrisomatales bacterium]
MDYRRDVVPPLVGAALSLALHAGMFWLPCAALFQPPEPDLIPVVVELLPGPGKPGKPADAGPSRPSKPLQPAKPAARPPRTEASRPRAERPAPSPKAPSAPAPEPSPPLEAPAPKAPPEPAATPPPERETSGAPSAPLEVGPAAPLRNLLPTRRDLAAYTGPTALPDPAGGTAREATLALGEADARYRGYLSLVQDAVDTSWRWKEALLAAGRGGSVLVRFSLTPTGQVAEVRIQEPSGNEILDKEAAQAILRSAMPPFPDHWTIERLNLFAQFDYKLE